jgi:hypothetical protein
MELTKRQHEILKVLEVEASDFSTKKDFVDAIKSSYANYQTKITKPKSYAFPTIMVANNSSIVEHEASVGRVSDTQLSYLRSRGLNQNQALSLVVTKSFAEVLTNLPLEFAIEAKKLIEISLEEV